MFNENNSFENYVKSIMQFDTSGKFFHKNIDKKIQKTILYIEQKGKCCFCGCQMYLSLTNQERKKNKLDGRLATLEHIIPKKYNGSDDFENYALSCSECNSERGHYLTFEQMVSLFDEFRNSYIVYTITKIIKREAESLKKSNGGEVSLKKIREILSKVIYEFQFSRDYKDRTST